MGDDLDKLKIGFTAIVNRFIKAEAEIINLRCEVNYLRADNYILRGEIYNMKTELYRPPPPLQQDYAQMPQPPYPQQDYNRDAPGS